MYWIDHGCVYCLSPIHLQEEVGIISIFKSYIVSLKCSATILYTVRLLACRTSMLQWLSWAVCPLPTRSPAGYWSRKGIHFRYVCRPQSKREKNHLLPLHLCHRHRQHSICLPRGEGPHLAGQPGGLQLGLKRWRRRCNSIGFVQLAVRRALQWFSVPHTAAEHYNPKQDDEKLQSKSPNDCTTDVFQISLLGSLKMDVSSYNEVCLDN